VQRALALVGCREHLGELARVVGRRRLTEAELEKRALAPLDAELQQVAERLHEQQRVGPFPGLEDRGVAPQPRQRAEALFDAVAAEDHHRLVDVAGRAARDDGLRDAHEHARPEHAVVVVGPLEARDPRVDGRERARDAAVCGLCDVAQRCAEQRVVAELAAEGLAEARVRVRIA